MRKAILLVGLGACAASTASPPATSAPTTRTSAEIARDADLTPKAQAVLGAFGNWGALLTRSGAVVFSSNRDGLPQLYVGEAAQPKAPPRKLPGPPERVAGMTLTGDERTVLFTSDVGADGNFHVFRVGVDGTGLADLTPSSRGGETLHRDDPVVALKRPDLFAYSAHAPSSEKTRVFLQSLDGTAPREIYADPRGGNLVDLAPDGKKALFVRANADEDAVLFEIDTTTAAATRLYPPEGQPASVAAAYSASADRVFVATQREGSHGELLAIDVKSGKTVARYEETLLPDSAIRWSAVSPAGDLVAIAIDAGNHSEIRLLDARTLVLVRSLAGAAGEASPVAFTLDGTKLTVNHSSPSEPPEIVVADVATGVSAPLRDEARPGLERLPPITWTIEKVPSFDGVVVPTNVYLPRRQTPATRVPVLVGIHGGPSSSAYVQWSPTTRFFASLGYAIVEPNIRGSTGFGVAYQKADDKQKRAGALEDVASVNRWARAQPWCDPDRIVIMGQSYGGYMTLLALGRQPQLWRAGLDVSGMSDLRTMEKLEDQSIRVYDETEFGVLGKEDDLLFEWSPLKYIDAVRSPVFIYQGVGDPVTPQNEADQMVKALRQRKIPVEYMLLANEGHGIVRSENKAEYLARAARFLETHLR